MASAVSSSIAGQNPALRRTVASAVVDSDTSALVSPADSPRASTSSTSLSSLASDANKPNKLVDGYGNEFQVPDFTIKELRDAIPKHCFERSAITSLTYVARDFVTVVATFYLFYTYVTPEYVPSTAARAGLWALYTVLQGVFATGLWVLAHECGHQAFSSSKILNDTAGWIMHSALLVPYFSWKISHGKHHKATGNMERDMVFVPKTRTEYASRWGKLVHEVTELGEETPIVTLLMLIGQQLVGWPSYLMSNVTGHNYHERQVEGRGKGKTNGWFTGVNHYNPSSPLYEAKDAKLIVLSDIGIAITTSALVYIGNNFGWSNLLVWYFIPYLFVNSWLVAVTFLQHTDPSLPHYTGESWDFVRGAAATIDRDFGFVGRFFFHGIIETHVLHHYISSIPFYHADEASEAIKKVMGRHYRADTRGGVIGFFMALWRSARWCQWVEHAEGAQGQDKGVLFFRNNNGLGVKPMKMSPPGL